MKSKITRMFALFASFGMIFVAALPALAGGCLGVWYEGLEPGTIYNMTGVTFDVPIYSGVGSLSGTDVSGDSMTLTENGGPYNFVYEQTSSSDSFYGCGILPQLLLGSKGVGGVFTEQIPIDGDTLFGFQSSPSDISVKMTFTDVTLPASTADLYMYDEFDASGPYLPLSGSITIELTTTIDGAYTIPHSTSISDKDPYTDDFVYDVQRYLESMRAKINDGSSTDITYFDSPKTFTAKIELDGSLIELNGFPEMDVLAIAGRVSEGTFRYSTEFDGQAYETILMERTKDEQINRLDLFAIDCPLYVNICSWSLSRYSNMGYGSPDNSVGVISPGGDDNGANTTPITNVINRPGMVLLIAAGTGAAALGVSILVSLIGDSLASATASAFSGYGSATGAAFEATPPAPEADVSLSASPEPNTDIPAEQVLDRTPDSTEAVNDENQATETPDDKTRDNEIADDKSKNRGAENEEDKEIQDDEQTDGESETPDLPEEDSPDVSMSLFAPATDLLNIKGGAADITVQIEGGEGYLWHYIPAVIVPGSMKAIVPTVTGHGNLATLVLGMTGTTLEERHYEVHINLIAWTTTPDGKILKTSKSMEMKLHQPGIEAKRNEKGFPCVTAYVETTLKGFAEIRRLSSDEYTYTKLEDGTLEIKAVNPKLGTTLLKP